MPNDDPTWGPPSPSQPWPSRAPAGGPEPPTAPRSRLLPPPPPTVDPPPTGRRPRTRLMVVAVLVVLLLGGAATAFALWPDSNSGPAAAGSPAATASGSAAPSTPELSAVDRTVRNAVIGDCLALRDGLDDAPPATASTVVCADPTATFTVVDTNGKTGAARPCRSDTTLRSTNVDRVLCLQRVFQAGQCVLGNGTSPFLTSAVGCGELPTAPFTQVFKIDAVSQPGQPVTCTPPAVQVSTSNRGLCLRQVR